MLHNRRGSDRVRDLMGQLPPDQAQILAKVYMEGKSHSEAALELDLPLGNGQIQGEAGNTKNCRCRWTGSKPNHQPSA